MAKAIASDVINLGFSNEMFDSIPGFSDLDSFIEFILSENIDEVKAEIGANVYDDATKLEDVKRIEKYKAAEELWYRRAGIVLSMAVPDGPDGRAEEKQAKRFGHKAKMIIDRLNGYKSVSFSSETSERV